MSKRFKARKNKNKYFFKLFLFILIVLLSFIISFNFLYKIITNNINETQVIDILLNNNDINIKNIIPTNGLDFFINYTLGLKLENDKQNKKEKVIEVIKDSDDSYENPLVYIYNTHQTEEYRGINSNDYNVIPTVMHASIILKNRLSDLGIQSIVETNSIKELLDINGWSYRNSYKASKILAQGALENNPSIKYVIDLHRDSIPENIAKTTINGKDYAKIMIVLGEGHEGFSKNLEMANRVNNYLKEFNENITRGIDIKKNSGIYNQDISQNALLIEIGGPYNDINSVKNSVEVLADIYKRVIDEDEKNKEA